jgi:hypothetical protein
MVVFTRRAWHGMEGQGTRAQAALGVQGERRGGTGHGGTGSGGTGQGGTDIGIAKKPETRGGMTRRILPK